MPGSLTEIRSHVSPDNWSHYPGLSNPADLSSRGLTLLELSVSQLWHQGPPWLHEQDAESTQEFDSASIPRECMREMKASKENLHSLLTTHQAPMISGVINCEDFSALTRLLRVTAYILRAAKLFKKSLVHPKKSLSPEEW